MLNEVTNAIEINSRHVDFVIFKQIEKNMNKLLSMKDNDQLLKVISTFTKPILRFCKNPKKVGIEIVSLQEKVFH